jgi:hypothetical protein
MRFGWPTSLGLRSNVWVRVRSADEVLSTLDDQGCLDGLPFQPEMLAYCGQRMRVAKVAHKTCDNIRKTGGRRMRDAVHLEGARCNGCAHGDCMADCVFFWKEAWLRREDDPPGTPPAATLNEQDLRRLTRAPGHDSAPDPTYVCQTTALFNATEALPWWDVRQYVRDVTTGNHRAAHVLKLLLFAAYRKLVSAGLGYRLLVGTYNRVQRWRGGKPYPLGSGAIADGKPTPTETLDLQVGEWVEVKSQEEILATISVNGFNRGMRYDMEMSQYAGERHRVQMRVERLINEQTGKMVRMKTPCIQLEDVYCRATCTERRLGCPRASNTYWREIWLRRVDGPHAR